MGIGLAAVTDRETSGEVEVDGALDGELDGELPPPPPPPQPNPTNAKLIANNAINILFIYITLRGVNGLIIQGI
jgi:hypothetical protein